MLYLLFLLFVFANSYKFAPINKYVRHYDNNYGVNVIERCKIEKKKTPCILFLTGGSGGIPPQIYSHFMDNLATHGFSIYTPHSQFKNRTLLIQNLTSEFKEVVVVGHSSGGTTAINYAKNPEIKKLILLDAVDTRIFSSKYRNRIHQLENLDYVLFLTARKSFKGSLNPPGIPFIPFLAVKPDIMNLKYSCKVINIEAKEFGHADILDLHYSNLMHKSRICVGYNNRTFENMNDYHNWLTHIFYFFTKENSRKMYKLPHPFIKWH